jgi:hypothetical protein
MKWRPFRRRIPSLSGRDLVPLARVDFLVFVVLMVPERHDGKQMIPTPYVEVIVEGLMNARSQDRIGG